MQEASNYKIEIWLQKSYCKINRKMSKEKNKLLMFLAILLLSVVAVLGYVFLRPSSVTYVDFCDEGCHETNLPYQNPELSAEERADDLLSRMTVAEKIGQMALVEKNSIKNLNDIARYGLGALLSGSGAKPDNNTPEGWLQMAEDFQSYGRKTRLQIPLLYGVDANHGHSNVPGATIFPHSIGLGAAKDPDLIKRIAEATSEEVSATGINWVFSPNVDVVQDIRWGRTYETFGSDAEVAGTLGRAYIEGLKVAGAAKHYVGQGSMVWGSSTNKYFSIDQGDSNISDNELRRIHLEPFRQAINAGVDSVMVGLSSWNGEKISFNKYLLTDVLKKELGFEGFVFSDWYGVYEKEKDKYEALVKAVNAGVDMIMLPFDYEDFSSYMHRALNNGDISPERINDAVRRILKVKFRTGLFDEAGTGAGLEVIGSEQHRELAREAVRKSLVLLKNNNAVPISKNASKILVAGSAANNLGRQSGGWTVEWQGIDGNWIPGTTILDGIKNSVSGDSKVEYSMDGNFSMLEERAEAGIAVVGESPYAEGWGDSKNLRLSKQDIEAINNLKKNSEKLIVVIVSGRPLDIKEYVNDWDVVVAAWLPGSEGQGVADVLFGDYNFTGILPVVWDL